MDNPNPNPAVPEGGAVAPDPNISQPGQGAAPVEGQPQTPSTFEELQTKKGFKSQEDFANSYVEVEKAYGKANSKVDKMKQQLESAGYVLEEDGTIRQAQQPTQQPGQPGYPPTQGYQQQPVPGMPQQQQPYQQPGVPWRDAQGQEMYDNYTGQPITNQMEYQLSQYPINQRQFFIANAVIQQNNQWNVAANAAESKIINNNPQAKGFESDVKQEMAKMTPEQRANEQVWQDTLYRVIGMKHGQLIQNAQQDGVNNFINKVGVQAPEGTGGASAGVGLSAEQEQTFQFYATNQPGLFKDRAHFKRSLSPTGGR